MKKEKKRLAHRTVSSYNSICEAQTWTLWSSWWVSIQVHSMPKALSHSEFLHFGASQVPEPKPISTLSSRETRPGSYQTDFCSPRLGSGLWGWEMQLIPREVALIARRYYCGQYQRGWQTYWFQSCRWTQVTSLLHGWGLICARLGKNSSVSPVLSWHAESISNH